MEIYDISQTLCATTAIWPGDPEFQMRSVQLIRRGDPVNLSELRMGSHTGTHVDAPLHVQEGGEGAASMRLDRFIGPVRVVWIPGSLLPGSLVIDAEILREYDWNGVQRVLFKTKARSTPETFNADFASLSEDAASFLVDRGIALVGIDAPSIDAFEGAELRAHRVFSRHGVPIIEGLRLDDAPPGDYQLACLPLKIAGGDGSPVRAILWR